MSDIKKAHPWVEPGLYVECPHCAKTNLLESDSSVSEASIPRGNDAFEYDCEHCKKIFLVTGDQDNE